MSACIIPVAPNFQDPPSVPDPGPYLTGYTPANGEIVAYTPPATTFKAIVTDQNVNTSLYVRWMFDYPPATATTQILPFLPGQMEEIKPGPDGQPIKQELSQEIRCDQLQYPNGLHQVELIVADLGFKDSSMVDPADTRFDTLMDSDRTGHIQYANWTIVMSCMAPTATGTSSP
jgi:hypothetical protein